MPQPDETCDVCGSGRMVSRGFHEPTTAGGMVLERRERLACDSCPYQCDRLQVRAAAPFTRT